MAQITKVLKDIMGLYVVAGGFISRPFYGTVFKEGDEVKTHHFGVSTNAGVTFNDKEYKFNKDGFYEYWCTTGIGNTEYKKKEFKKGYEKLFGGEYNTFEEYLVLDTKWYKETNRDIFQKEANKKFKRDHIK